MALTAIILVIILLTALIATVIFQQVQISKLLKQYKNVPNTHEPASPVRDQAVHEAPSTIPQASVDAPSQVPMQAQAPQVGAPAQVNIPVQASAPAPVLQHPPATGALDSAMPVPPNHSGEPHRQLDQSHSLHLPHREQSSQSVESWIGQNVIGMLAALLVFIGIIVLGTVEVLGVGDGVRVALMALLSVMLTGFGAFISKKWNSTVANVILGTGMGSLFITIMLAHTNFGLIGQPVAYVLMTLWLIGGFVLVRSTNSTIVSLVSHLGMGISLIHGFITVTDEGPLAILVGYQIISTIAVVVGNFLCSKKTYRFGLYFSLALSVFASSIMWVGFYNFLEPEVPVVHMGLLIGVYTVQFVGASILSYLLFVSSVRLKNAALSLISHIATMILWLSALFLNVGVLANKVILVNYAAYSSGAPEDVHLLILVPCLVTLVILVLVAVAFTLIMKVLPYSKLLYRTTIALLAFTAAKVLLVNQIAMGILGLVAFNLTYLPLLVLALAILGRIQHDKVILRIAQIILAFECFWMIIILHNNYFAMGGIGFAALALVAMLILIYVLARLLHAEGARGSYSVTRILGLLFVIFSIAQITYLAFPLQGYAVANPAIALVLLGSVLIGLDDPHRGLRQVAEKDKALEIAGKSPLHLAVRVVELICVFVASAFFSIRPGEFMVGELAPIAVLLLNLLTLVVYLALLGVRLFQAARTKQSALEVLTGLEFSALVVFFLNGQTHLLAEASAFSIAWMLTAFICIIVGFALRIRSIRLYGLVAMLFFVIKLVTFDVASQDIIVRIIALIVGGIMCFMLSAVYTYLDKRWGKEQDRPAPQELH